MRSAHGLFDFSVFEKEKKTETFVFFVLLRIPWEPHKDPWSSTDPVEAQKAITLNVIMSENVIKKECNKVQDGIIRQK